MSNFFIKNISISLSILVKTNIFLSYIPKNFKKLTKNYSIDLKNLQKVL